MTLLHKLVFFLLFITALKLTSQDKPEYSILSIDTSLLKNADAVVRSEETRYIIESPRNYIHHSSKVVTIFNKGAEEANIFVPYSKYSKAEIIHLSLYDAFGRFIRRIKKSEIEDQASYSDNSIAHDERFLSFRSFGGQLPYTIEYEWKIKYDQTQSYPDWTPLDFNESIEKGIFQVETPAGLMVHTQTLNHDFIYLKEMLNTRETQTWTILNHPAITKESSGPPVHELIPTILVSPSVFQVEDYAGSMSDWKGFGKFLYELNKGKDKMTPEMSSRIQHMTKDFHTTKEKIDTLYHWLQENIRYVSVQFGIGGWQAFDAAYVDKNRYGDCKALSTFMKGMLNEIGVESYPVIIKWDEEDALFLDNFMNSDFNHMLLHVPGENLWLECTSKYLPAGILHEEEQNKKVLLVTPDGGVIARTPASPLSANRIETIDTIAYNGSWFFKGKRKYSGNESENIREIHYYLSSEQQQNVLMESIPLQLNKLEAFSISENRETKEWNLTYHGLLNQFGTISGDRLFITSNEIYPLKNYNATKRETDYISKDNSIKINDIFIKIPEGYTIEYLPSSSNYNFKENHFELKFEVGNNFIHIQQKAQESAMRLTPEEYSDLCQYYHSVSKANSAKIVLKKNTISKT